MRPTASRSLMASEVVAVGWAASGWASGADLRTSGPGYPLEDSEELVGFVTEGHLPGLAAALATKRENRCQEETQKLSKSKSLMYQ